MNVFQAAIRGDLERIRAVVEQDAELVIAMDGGGRTPLLCAADGGHVEVVRYLLQHGAVVVHPDSHGWTAPHYACWGHHADVVLLLLQWGAYVGAVNEQGRTPLIVAASRGGDAVVRALLEHGGSDVDAADNNRRTALHWACTEGHGGVLRQLLEAGADPAMRDAYGRTACGFAAASRQQGCVKVLQGWDRAYTLYRARSVCDASLIVANSSGPVDAAPPYLVNRATSGLVMPTVHVRTHQQLAQSSHDVSEEGHVEVGPIAIGGVVTLYAIEELKKDVFVELLELVGTTGFGAHEL